MSTTRQDVATYPANTHAGGDHADHAFWVNGHTLHVVVRDGSYKPPEGWQIVSVRSRRDGMVVRLKRTGGDE